jgi:hypothetical protein
MSKVNKKIVNLEERINYLQSELNQSLTKKSGRTAEINVSEYQRKILELRTELLELKMKGQGDKRLGA